MDGLLLLNGRCWCTEVVLGTEGVGPQVLHRRREEVEQVTSKSHMLTWALECGFTSLCSIWFFYNFVYNYSKMGGSTSLRTHHVPHKLSESKTFIYSLAKTTVICKNKKH